MRAVLSSNPYRDKGLRAALEAKGILERAGAQVSVCLPFPVRKNDHLELPKQVKLQKMEEVLPQADLLICFGGDGTILHAARDATLHDVPVLGINMGSVGFMAELERGELPLLERLVRRDYHIEDRMMLSVQLMRGGKVIHEDLALNDVLLSKGSIARVAEMQVWADDIMVTELTGDGVIVSTPTGSTAYSMSAGGPIVEPTSHSIIVTPICAHQLAARSMVLAPERRVTVRLPRDSRKHLYLAVDGGKALRMGGTERVEITRSERCTRLVRLTQRNFYQIVHQKLGG